jgi:hypothetical protein
MASANTANRERTALEDSVNLKGLDGILRAAWRKAAGAGRAEDRHLQRREQPLINADEKY